MKKQIIQTSILLCASFLTISLAINASKKSQTVEAATLPTSIDTNDSSEADIRAYYSDLLEISDHSQLRGTNLLKNLKKILEKNTKYYTFSEDRKIAKIVDRQWDASPLTSQELANYNYDDNPYMYYYYRSDNFTNPHTFSDEETPTSGSPITMFNQEHLWSVSHGFDDEERQVPNAGTDLHHLVAGDAAINQWGHSNYTYGNVQDEKSSWIETKTKWDNGSNAILGNKLGTNKNVHAEDVSNTVFEPQDCDKGDIARALFYMAARYNNYDGETPTQEEPALSLIDYVGDDSGKGVFTGTYGIVSDLVEWHYEDIVTTSSLEGKQEIHRNNLIYTNYQNNRNPFIDFPEWVDLIWGNNTTGYANPATDKVYGYNESDIPTAITLNETSINLGRNSTFDAYVAGSSPSKAIKTVTWSSSDSSIASVTSSGTILGVKNGTAIITATSTEDSNVKASLTVTVETIALNTIALEKDYLSLKEGSNYTLSPIFSPANASDKEINWSSSDETVAKVNDGVIVAVGYGSATISATSSVYSSISDCVKVYVTSNADTTYIYQKIDDISLLTDGDYLIVNENYSIALNGSLPENSIGSSKNTTSIASFFNSTNLTIEANQITNNLSFYIDASDGSLMSQNEYYIGRSGNTAGVDTSVNPISNYISFDGDGNVIIAPSSTSKLTLSYYNSYSAIKFYLNKSAIQLYKKVENGGSKTISQSYKKITDSSELTSGMYVITSQSSYSLPTSFPTTSSTMSSTSVSVSENQISLADAIDRVVYLNVKGDKVSISNGSNYLVYNSNTSTGLLATSSEFFFTVTYNKNGFKFDDGTTGDGRYLAFNTSNSCFGFYKTFSQYLLLYKYCETIEETYSKTDFANEFLTYITCDALGHNLPSFASNYSWNDFKSKFESLSVDDKASLKNGIANASSLDVIERALARYDYIVNKYNAYSSYHLEDFIGRFTFLNNRINISNDEIDIASTFAISIITISLCGVALIGLYIIKHKHN